jgi:hypothetical protein
MYPDVQFQHQWADEDTGHNVGEVTYADGEYTEYDIPTGGSKEAYEMAASVMDIELADFDLHYDEETGTYEYVESEFAHLIRVLHDKPAADVDERLRKAIGGFNARDFGHAPIPLEEQQSVA